jgi:hypothetical protein
VHNLSLSSFFGPHMLVARPHLFHLVVKGAHGAFMHYMAQAVLVVGGPRSVDCVQWPNK